MWIEGPKANPFGGLSAHEFRRGIRHPGELTEADEEFYHKDDLVYLNASGQVIRAAAGGVLTDKVYIVGQDYDLAYPFPAAARSGEHPLAANGVPLHAIHKHHEFHGGLRFVANTNAPGAGDDYELEDDGRAAVNALSEGFLYFDATADRLNYHIILAGTNGASWEPNVQVLGFLNKQGYPDGAVNPRVRFRLLEDFIGA